LLKIFIKIDDLVFTSYLKINRSLGSYKDPSDFGNSPAAVFVFVGISIELSGGLGRNLTELNNANRMNPRSPEDVNRCDIFSTASVLLSKFYVYLLHVKKVDLFCVTD